MGITINEAKLILKLREYKHCFGKLATIGRQNLFLTPADITETLASANIPSHEINSYLEKDHTYCEEYFKLLGANQIDSFDASNYENATIIHNMNFPIPTDLMMQYDTVIDSGTLEHVFNFPVAIKNCMELVKKGGYFIGITPANNFFGHGFYQFSPEVYFRIFSEENGFAIKRVTVYQDHRNSNWYELKDPKELANRITLINSKPLFISVIAQKTSDVTPFSKFPNQSDYNDRLWENKKVIRNEAFRVKGFLSAIKKMIPYSLKEKALNIRSRIKVMFSETGTLDSYHYKKTDKN